VQSPEADVLFFFNSFICLRDCDGRRFRSPTVGEPTARNHGHSNVYVILWEKKLSAFSKLGRWM